MDGECIHKIERMEDYYAAFGYTTDIAKSGLLPDEFIWEAYIKDNPLALTECLQVHFIEYLLHHSAPFRKKHAKECGKWIASHLAAISDKGISCATCSKNQLSPEHQAIELAASCKTP